MRCLQDRECAFLSNGASPIVGVSDQQTKRALPKPWRNWNGSPKPGSFDYGTRCWSYRLALRCTSLESLPNLLPKELSCLVSEFLTLALNNIGAEIGWGWNPFFLSEKETLSEQNAANYRVVSDGNPVLKVDPDMFPEGLK